MRHYEGMAAKKRSAAPNYPPILELTPDELQLLTECPYENPGRVQSHEKDIAERLIGRGLLEMNPSTLKGVLFVRCTDAGEKQVRPLSHERVKYERDRIEELWKKGSESMARHLRHILLLRILAECALSGSRNASIALEICDFI